MRHIDRNVVLLGWVSFFTDMASAMINPLIPVFIVSVLNDVAVKLLFGLAFVVLLCRRPDEKGGQKRCGNDKEDNGAYAKKRSRTQVREFC